MSKRDTLGSVLVYVHGTNGSGKSTLARCIGAAAGGFDSPCWVGKGRSMPDGKPIKATFTPTPRGVHLLGKYDRACGGVDGISPYAAVHKVVTTLKTLHWELDTPARVFAEGLLTPGVETCQTLASHFKEHRFIVLVRPPKDCVSNVLARRARKGTDKPYTGHDNLTKKYAGALHWGDRLERVGLQVERLHFWDAYSLSLELLGLPLPSVEDILE